MVRKAQKIVDTPLFDYVETVETERSRDSHIAEKYSNIRRFYATNFLLVAMILLSIYSMFFIQLKVDGLQNRINIVKNEIFDYEDEIRVLEVEWVYLTRPERLRVLSKRYLKNNDYTDSGQIKNIAQLEKHYINVLEKNGGREFAMK